MYVKWTNQRKLRWKFSFFLDYLGGKGKEKLNHALKIGGVALAPFGYAWATCGRGKRERVYLFSWKGEREMSAAFSSWREEGPML